jgi:uncharacterized membrane protein YedE/YeeE
MLQDIVYALIGGMIIGLASSFMLLFHGRIFGISGIIAGVLKPEGFETWWRIAAVLGLVTGGVLIQWFGLPAFPTEAINPSGITILAGLLVGFGTRLGSGCTSGHGICGISRLSPRSIIATLTFMATGFITVYIFRHLMMGGAA